MGVLAWSWSIVVVRLVDWELGQVSMVLEAQRGGVGWVVWEVELSMGEELIVNGEPLT
jgi:hypothetical protein